MYSIYSRKMGYSLLSCSELTTQYRESSVTSNNKSKVTLQPLQIEYFLLFFIFYIYLKACKEILWIAHTGEKLLYFILSAYKLCYLTLTLICQRVTCVTTANYCDKSQVTFFSENSLLQKIGEECRLLMNL